MGTVVAVLMVAVDVVADLEARGFHPTRVCTLNDSSPLLRPPVGGVAARLPAPLPDRLLRARQPRALVPQDGRRAAGLVGQAGAGAAELSGWFKLQTLRGLCDVSPLYGRAFLL